MDKPFAEWKSMTLPDGSTIHLISEYADGTRLSFHDANHNIVRIGADGRQIWQVRRDENGRYPFELIRQRAIEAGNFDAPRNSFLNATWTLRDSDGQPYTGKEMIPGLKMGVAGNVHTSTGLQNSAGYELDIDSGVATNLTPIGGRPW